MTHVLEDSFGRKFSYLRLSVTEVCNFRCAYCLPDGYKKNKTQAFPLTLPEIGNLVSAFAGIGFRKVRITGGEPTTRGDIVEIARIVSSTPGIERVGISTNGYRLKTLAPSLKQAGVSAVNLSIDSLVRDRFARITGVDRLPEILDGFELAMKLGFDAVKVNVVLLSDLSGSEIEQFIELAREKQVSVRFIEVMQTAENGAFFQSNHRSGHSLKEQLLTAGWQRVPRGAHDGAAEIFSHSRFKGTIGIIAPYAKDFCTSCNRLRVTSQGKLRLCLFGEADHSLRPLLATAGQREELQATVRNLLSQKEVSHFLSDGKYGDTPNLSSIGG